jgi:hypothetical protein
MRSGASWAVVVAFTSSFVLFVRADVRTLCGSTRAGAREDADVRGFTDELRHASVRG